MSLVISTNMDYNFTNIIKVIELDVERTFFVNDIEKSRRVKYKYI
jgi:hypothetical protein